MERNLEHLVREIEKISYGKKRNKAKRNLRMGSDVPSKRKEKSVRAVVTDPGIATRATDRRVNGQWVRDFEK
jgi:hypothetical protein